jgi:hypothetical protein
MTKNLHAKILMKLLNLLTKSLGFYAFFLMIRSDRPEKLGTLGTQDEDYKKTTKQTQYVLDITMHLPQGVNYKPFRDLIILDITLS